VLKYDTEGLVEWNGNLYYVVKYDDPNSSLRQFVKNDRADQ